MTIANSDHLVLCVQNVINVNEIQLSKCKQSLQNVSFPKANWGSQNSNPKNHYIFSRHLLKTTNQIIQ